MKTIHSHALLGALLASLVILPGVANAEGSKLWKIVTLEAKHLPGRSNATTTTLQVGSNGMYILQTADGSTIMGGLKPEQAARLNAALAQPIEDVPSGSVSHVIHIQAATDTYTLSTTLRVKQKDGSTAELPLTYTGERGATDQNAQAVGKLAECLYGILDGLTGAKKPAADDGLPSPAAKLTKTAGAEAAKHGATVEGGEPGSEKLHAKVVKLDDGSIALDDHGFARSISDSNQPFYSRLRQMEGETVDLTVQKKGEGRVTILAMDAKLGGAATATIYDADGKKVIDAFFGTPVTIEGAKNMKNEKGKLERYLKVEYVGPDLAKTIGYVKDSSIPLPSKTKGYVGLFE